MDRPPVPCQPPHPPKPHVALALANCLTGQHLKTKNVAALQATRMLPEIYIMSYHLMSSYVRREFWKFICIVLAYWYIVDPDSNWFWSATGSINKTFGGDMPLFLIYCFLVHDTDMRRYITLLLHGWCGLEAAGSWIVAGLQLVCSLVIFRSKSVEE